MTNAVLQVNVYMRQKTSGFKGRRFQIFIELQAAPNQIQTRSYSNNYTIVVTPSADRGPSTSATDTCTICWTRWRLATRKSWSARRAWWTMPCGRRR